MPPGAGTSAMLPRWADLKVYVSADFDPGSSITLAFAFRAQRVEHREFGDMNPEPRAVKRYEKAWPIFPAMNYRVYCTDLH